jgi:hypothetical protein
MSYKIPQAVLDAVKTLPKEEQPARLKEIERIANAPISSSMFPEYSLEVQYNYLMGIATKRINIGS